MDPTTVVPNLLTASKVAVFAYILASPMIVHDSSCALNTTATHIAALVVSGAATVVDTTLGLLMIMASLIMIGSFNYDATRKTEFSPEVSVSVSSTSGSAPAPAPVLTEPLIPESSGEHAPHVHKDAHARAPQRVEHAPHVHERADLPNPNACVTETYEPLDFLRSPALNPGGFVSDESLARVQTNEVAPGSLGNVYSPLGSSGVYTAQGVLPGSGIKALEG